MSDPRLASSFSLPSRRAVEAVAAGDAARKLFGSSTAGSSWCGAAAPRAESMGPVLNVGYVRSKHMPVLVTSAIPIGVCPTTIDDFPQKEPVDRDTNDKLRVELTSAGRHGTGQAPVIPRKHSTEYARTFPSPTARQARRARPRSCRKRSSMRKIIAPDRGRPVPESSTQEVHAPPFEGVAYRGEVRRPATQQMLDRETTEGYLTSQYHVDYNSSFTKQPREARRLRASASAPSGALTDLWGGRASGSESRGSGRPEVPWSDQHGRGGGGAARRRGGAFTKDLEFDLEARRMRSSNRFT